MSTARTRIDTQLLRGIWPPMLLYWDQSYALDQKTTDANLERQIASGPHGLYTLDTASEFFTLELADWEQVARRFVSRCRAAAPKMPIGLGCTWTNQDGALARIARARDLDVDVIHLAPPYWVPLNETGVFRFFEAVQTVAGHLGVVIYAPPHGKLVLTADLYRRLVEIAPCIAGTKTLGTDPALLGATGPDGKQHSHFVQECHLVSGVQKGALGNYSALAGVNMKLMKHFWSLLESGQWAAAQALQEPINRFYQQAVVPIRDAGILAGAIDKAMAQVGGAVGSRRMRPPYQATTDELYQGLVNAARELPPVP